MPEDPDPDDVILAESLGAFSARPLLDGTAELDAARSDPAPEWRSDDEPPEDESSAGRLVAWVRWAAAPLGFFLFLTALTAYGLLRDRDGTSDPGSRPAVAPQTTSAPATTVATAEPATTAPALQITVTPSTRPPATVPATTLPPEPSGPTSPVAPPPGLDPDPPPPPAANDPPPRSYGPVCGYSPGETVEVEINGRPEGLATADGDGCVSVTR